MLGMWTRKARSVERKKRDDCCEFVLTETHRKRSIVLVGDMQGSSRQPARVGANSTGPIVVIDSSVSVLALRGELHLCL